MIPYPLKIISYCIVVLTFASCKKQFTLKSTEGNFSVNFPEKPNSKTLGLPAADGTDLKIVTYTYLSADSNIVYLLSYNIIPDFAGSDPDSILDKAKKDPAQRMRTTIVEEKKISLDGYPGIYFKGLGLDIAMVYYIYMVKDRMYQLAILNKIPREPNYNEIKSFMGSFKLLHRP